MAGLSTGEREQCIRILCVADESGSGLIADTLDRERDWFSVHAEASAQAATEYLLDSGTSVDCVVSTDVLPDSTGLSVLETVRDHFPALPFVLLSEESDVSAADAFERGVTVHFPVADGVSQPGLLAAQIEAHVDQYWLAVREHSIRTLAGRVDGPSRGSEHHQQDLAFRTALLEAQAETTIDGLLVVDADRNVLYHNDRFLEMWGIPESVAMSRSDETLLDYVDTLLADSEEFREKVQYLYANPDEESRDTIRLTDGQWFDRYSSPVVGADGTSYGRLWAFRDITDRKEREQTLETQRDELANLQRINDIVRELNEALQGKTTRSAIERAVCDRLTESALYQAAWIGTRETDSSGTPIVTPQTSAGVDDDYLDGIPGNERGPACTAFDIGESQLVADIEVSDGFPAYRREVALDAGHHSLVAVPLATGETTYGVLVVYAPGDHRIDEREETVLEDFGRSIARAIQRVQSQRALAADTAVELELRIPDADIGFAEVSDELDCELVLDRRVPASGGTGIYYITVHDADPSQVRDALLDAPSLTDCNVVRDADGSQSGGLEIIRSDDSHLPLDALLGHGAAIMDARAVDGDLHFNTEAPPEADVRTLVESVRDLAPAVELVSKRQVSRPVRTVAEITDQVRDQLTPKQEAAVKTAYARGYYAWPRENTVEEIAEVLDISASTLHYHLRHAHQTVLAALFDTYEESPGGTPPI